MQYEKSSLYDQVRDFLLTGELYEVTATSGANLRKSRGSREPRGSKLIHEGINYLSIRSGLARALWLKTPSYVKWP